jgi:salicylate hydroxylase
MRIAIVGAGIGGLSLAGFLNQSGIHEVHLFERSHKLSSRGGTIRLDTPTQEVLAQLGVIDEVCRTGIRLERIENFGNGKTIGYRDDTHERAEPLVSISREALQAILSRTTGSAAVHMGREVCDICENNDLAELSFETGGTASFDLVIGADGIYSIINDALFPGKDMPEFTGFVVYFCIAKGAYVPGLKYVEHFISRGNTGFRQVTAAGGGSDGRWDSLQITTRGEPCSSEWSAEGTYDEVRYYLDLAGDHCLPGAREILENADRTFKWGMFQSPARETWISPRQRVVLLGDAAHAMAPFTGQGACSAIQDSQCLATELATQDRETALRNYENARKPICEKSIAEANRRGMLITAHGATRWFLDTHNRYWFKRMRAGAGRDELRRLHNLSVRVVPVMEMIDSFLDHLRA